MYTTIARLSFIIVSSLVFAVISLAIALGSNKPPPQSSGHVLALANAPNRTPVPTYGSCQQSCQIDRTRTPVPTVTGWLTPTPSPTGTPPDDYLTPTSTIYPGPPLLISPPEHVLMPQPVPPEDWYFRWSADCWQCESSITIHGPGGRVIWAETGLSEEFCYVTDTYLAEDALGPWIWHVEVLSPGGSNKSEHRIFWVRNADFRLLYLPGVVHGAP